MPAGGAFAVEVFGTDSYEVQANSIQHSLKDKADLIERGFAYADSVTEGCRKEAARAGYSPRRCSGRSSEGS
jgi:hypothetical protein